MSKMTWPTFLSSSVFSMRLCAISFITLLLPSRVLPNIAVRAPHKVNRRDVNGDGEWGDVRKRHTALGQPQVADGETAGRRHEGVGDEMKERLVRRVDLVLMSADEVIEVAGEFDIIREERVRIEHS